MPLTARDFTDWLAEVPLDTWHGAALACPLELPRNVDALLESALGAPEIAVDVWNTRDDLETALWRFTSLDGRGIAKAHRQRRHIALVTERAALALVVREQLGDGPFAHAFGAFAKHLPI